MTNPYNNLLQTNSSGKKFYNLSNLTDERINKLPYSIRVVLESAIRNCDNFEISESDVENILNWEITSKNTTEIPFKPARVILQDFTGVPAVVDFAAMRDAMHRLGGDPKKINPLVPADLVIDHSVQVDFSRNSDALELNEKKEYERNKERFEFLKWGAKAFENMLIVPPGSGIVHQVNLEYLARVVFSDGEFLYPDSLVGTDSHTTMINGLGVVGWGVGGIEAEAVMLGQSVSMVLPQVIGFKLTGVLSKITTATDLVLIIVKMLRQKGVVGKFVEFFGDGVKSLSLADRATIANMAPEYGATMGFFPIDDQTLTYLRQTGREEKKIAQMEEYLKCQKLFRTYEEADPHFTDILELDLSTVVPAVSGPKRPHDHVNCSDLKKDFLDGLSAPVSFKGFGLKSEDLTKKSTFSYRGHSYDLSHGSVVIAAITSCTNTSNPGVMLGAGLLARNALAKGLTVAPYIKTSLSPGSGVVEKYLKKSGLITSLEGLGFFTAGFGCMTCIGNSGDLDPEVSEAISSQDLVASAVLSGNRNFEGRVHPLTRANYLASPPLVVAYALAGKVTIDFETEPIGVNSVSGENVFLRDIWPSSDDIKSVESSCLESSMFTETYKAVAAGTDRWNALKAPEGDLYSWNDKSTYIHNPPFFAKTTLEPSAVIPNIENARVLLNLGDSVTTDHISPAGKIVAKSPAGRYLIDRGINPGDFNSYGSRRGNDEIMARGTFANIRLVNKFLNGKTGPMTTHFPSEEVLDIYDAAAKYIESNTPTIILAGKEYGSGSSRDWAAKGPYLQGVKAVIAQSFERIHRSNLVGLGILPLQFLDGENADSLNLSGKEIFSIDLKGGEVSPGDLIKVTTSCGREFFVKSRIDTLVEVSYFKHGGILNFVLRKLAAK